MEINVPALGQTFEMPRRHLAPYSQAEMARALQEKALDSAFSKNSDDVVDDQFLDAVDHMIEKERDRLKGQKKWWKFWR